MASSKSNLADQLRDVPSSGTDNAGTRLLVCQTCRVSFVNGLAHKQHWKSDWHRFNLQRLVAEMPTVTADQFVQLVSAANEQIKGSNGERGGQGSIFKCAACSKTFNSLNAFEDHKLSRKHERANQIYIKSINAALPDDCKFPRSPASDISAIRAVPYTSHGARIASLYNDQMPIEFFRDEDEAISEHDLDDSAKHAAGDADSRDKLDNRQQSRVDQARYRNSSSFDSRQEGTAISGNKENGTLIYANRHIEEYANDADDEGDASAEASALRSGMASLDVNDDAADAHQDRSGNQNDLTPNDCLFCPHHFSDYGQNVLHMAQHHNFWIPEDDYLVDLPGLLRYLGGKLAIGHTCIACRRQARSLQAIRKHIEQKRHYRMSYDTEAEQLEYAEFYDFTPSWSEDTKEKDKQKIRHHHHNHHRGTEEHDLEDNATDIELLDSVDNNEDWESASSSTESTIDSDDIDSLQVDPSYLELTLPSGARIGHRSLARYYRQYLPNHPLRNDSDDRVGRARVRVTSAVAHRNAVQRGLQSATRTQLRLGQGKNKFQQIKRVENFRYKMGLKNNMQKHFRDALLQ